MDEILKAVLGQSIVATVLLVGIVALYIDLRKRFEKADQERALLIQYILDSNNRTRIVEKEVTGDNSPTLPKRP